MIYRDVLVKYSHTPGIARAVSYLMTSLVTFVGPLLPQQSSAFTDFFAFVWNAHIKVLILTHTEKSEAGVADFESICDFCREFLEVFGPFAEAFIRDVLSESELVGGGSASNESCVSCLEDIMTSLVNTTHGGRLTASHISGLSKKTEIETEKSPLIFYVLQTSLTLTPLCSFHAWAGQTSIILVDAVEGLLSADLSTVRAAVLLLTTLVFPYPSPTFLILSFDGYIIYIFHFIYSMP